MNIKDKIENLLSSARPKEADPETFDIEGSDQVVVQEKSTTGGRIKGNRNVMISGRVKITKDSIEIG